MIEISEVGCFRFFEYGYLHLSQHLFNWSRGVKTIGGFSIDELDIDNMGLKEYAEQYLSTHVKDLMTSITH